MGKCASVAGRKWIFAACVAGFCWAGHASYGLTITPTFDVSITSDANAAAIESTINSAINIYQSTFSDPINVTIQFKEMTSGLGMSNTWIYKLNYNSGPGDFLPHLISDATSANDFIALSHLPNAVNNPVNGTSTINLKTANIRALGIPGSFPSGLAGGFDGIISLNTSITFPPQPSGSPNYFLQATAEHEIDEVLGLGSDLPGGGTGGFFNDPMPEDLYRYDSSGNRNFTTAGDNAFFSIDGTTDLARFNQNSTGDYGDWWSTGPHTPQVQDAFATPGATPSLGSAELTALDVIGYTLAAPEPASASCLLLGAVTLVARRRRR